MKKSYLMIVAVAAIFAACGQTDTFKDVDTQDAVIGFGHSATEKSTRAELDMTWFRTLNNGFGVYGYKNDAEIFKNENVKCSLATSPYEWSHTTIRFWDKAATDAYDFYAYAPFAGTNNSTTNANPTFDKSTGFTFTGLPLIVDITTDGADKAIANAVEDIDYTDGRLHGTHANSPTVQFVFNHILSKLSFKIKTDIPAHNASTNPTATFTVKSIKIDFPSDNNVTWAETNSNAVAGTTTYSDNYAPKTGSKADAAFETTVFTGSQVATATATALGNTYIVAPVNGTVKKHEFDVQVVYDILYADGTTESDCVATGTIGSGNPAATNPADENVYAPAQNQYFVAIINIHPDEIQFCVENVADWNPNGGELDEVDVK